ncbi:autotransporter outer membrane beta-barrel domain-containing protein [Pseudomonas rubra]|uniref:Autotransporter outer membrane beta-barrel domain-containing protein n=1 Tax=Pseudomonas rubra TaxID=2942627 RepID=A0ABT5PAE3_9PSED|nr:autotransporter outer membrane beta-barrel domain-containing protein [Pseudomonas rubra]MDD1015137.1 autotransporter outer membrane beta-barrel domain-containing protein [Pseudomonas rubra]MDD1037716.1 autotransporter outer membrane beta-barrel domain-containing protein [Pseudomonas rubra]MDD1157364.1 autotransporter outer membrane beta-barrel domain-containing protein [Pseudomonas rubra]
MKKTANPTGFEYVFYAVSTSLLLATPLETHALGLEDNNPLNNLVQAQPALSLIPVSTSGLGLSTLGAFSERLAERNAPVASDTIASQWAQFFPTPVRTPSPEADNLSAPNRSLQISPDLFVRETSGGNVHRAGFFVGHSNLQSGFDGLRKPQVGDRKTAVNLDGESLGVYWSMSHDQGWHLDAVAMGTRFDINGRSETGQRLDGNGHALTLSVEGGYPISLGNNWTLEPQAQLINQQYFPGSQTQTDTQQAFDEQPNWTGRVGAKLSARYNVRGMPIEPFVRTNVWYDFSNADTVSLDKVDKISSGRNSATVELGLGLVARVTPKVALFVSADYSSDMDDNDINGLIGNLGIRVRW